MRASSSAPRGQGAAEVQQRRHSGARQREFVGQPRVAQRMRDLRLVDDLHQLPRAQQRHVPTAMPPAFTTPNQQAASIGELAPRSSTRLPGTGRGRPPARGDAVGLLPELGIGPAHVLALDAQPGALAGVTRRSSSWVAQFIRGELQFGQLEKQLGQRSAGGGRRSRAKVSRCAVAAWKADSSTRRACRQCPSVVL
jgi:hypothetical protein